MGFMRPEIIGPQEWWQIDGACGITYVPADCTGTPVDDNDEPLISVGGTAYNPKDSEDEHTQDQWEEVLDCVADYYEGRREQISEVSLITGYGARLSAPGYMDSTDWTVFDTKRAAEESLAEEFDLCDVEDGGHLCLEELDEDYQCPAHGAEDDEEEDE